MQTQNEIEIPPHSAEAEQAVLGGLILDNDSWSDVGVMLEERDFFSMEHQHIFRAIASLSEKKEPFDFVTLADELDNQGKLDDAGGMSYLTTLATETPSASNIKAYANIVRERAARRRLIIGAREMSALAFHHDISVDEMREKSKKVIDEALGKSLHDGEVVKVSSYLSSIVDMADKAQHGEDAVTGLQTGFIDIDKILLNRIQPDDLVVIAGRPSMGKSVMGMNLIENFLKNDDEPGCAVVFTLEMSSKQLALRMVSGRSAVSINRFADGSLKDEDWPRITKAVADIDGLPLYLDDSPVQTIHSIRSKVLKIANREPVKAVLVDYLQLMSFANGRSDDSRSALIGDISRGLKTLAKEVQAPVIALSQLNRALEGRNNKRPRMSDLRDSGSIEQDADIIAMLYRDEVYNDSVPQTKGIAEVNIVKNRNGPIGQAALVFQGEYTRFVNGDQSTIGRYWGGIHRRNPRAELDDE